MRRLVTALKHMFSMNWWTAKQSEKAVYGVLEINKIVSCDTHFSYVTLKWAKKNNSIWDQLGDMLRGLSDYIRLTIKEKYERD
jgi:hypothetical protein